MSSSNATPTFQEMNSSILLSYYLYEAIGGIAIISNSIIIVVFWSSRILRVKYQLLIALAVADLINGVAFVVSGAVKERLFWSIEGYNLPPWTVWDCATEAYPPLLILGAQWPACITLILGMERFAAVHLPVWYKMNINAKARFKLVLASLLFSLISLGIAFPQSYIFFRNTPTIFLCTISGAFGRYYTTWNYIVTIFGHLIAFALNASAFLTAKSKSRAISSGLSATMKKEITLVRLMLGLSLFSVLLVSIPNVILWGQSWIWNTTGSILGLLYVSFCASSVVNIFIYFFFNKEFRTRFLRLICCGSPSKSAVEPINTQNMPKNTLNMNDGFLRRSSSLASPSYTQTSRKATTVALVSIYD